MEYFDELTVDHLQEFDDHGYTEEEALDMSKGLLTLAVPCLERIENLSVSDKAIIKSAVFEMAKYIMVDYLNFEAATSPFQSETIGSYTYSKMMHSVKTQTSTGVPGFDRAVSYFEDLCASLFGGDGINQATSEQVFKPGFDNFLEGRERVNPYNTYGMSGRPRNIYTGYSRWW